jgi:hypothetical protein
VLLCGYRSGGVSAEHFSVIALARVIPRSSSLLLRNDVHCIGVASFVVKRVNINVKM